jgi:phosphomannomutase
LIRCTARRQGGLSALLEAASAKGVVREIRANRDPLFGGNPPEPLAPYLQQLIAEVKASTAAGLPAVGIVFDGDGDRIAAVDERGRFCSTQLLMPLFIDHLAQGPPAARRRDQDRRAART